MTAHRPRCFFCLMYRVCLPPVIESTSLTSCFMRSVFLTCARRRSRNLFHQDIPKPPRRSRSDEILRRSRLPEALTDEFTKQYPNVSWNVLEDQLAVFTQQPRALSDSPPDLIRLPQVESSSGTGACSTWNRAPSSSA